MTSATEILRRLLDERGVEWWPMHDVENGYREDRDTEFLVYGCKHVAHEWGCRLQVDMLTPEQAIDATLGRGTCRDVGRYAFVCSVCGWASDEPHHVLGGFWPKYCPECGRAVVE
mgnify:CR=1 FL=1